MILFFFSQVDSQARAPLASVSYLQAPTRACQVSIFFPTRACQVPFFYWACQAGIIKITGHARYFLAPTRVCQVSNIQLLSSFSDEYFKVPSDGGSLTRPPCLFRQVGGEQIYLKRRDLSSYQP